MIPRLLTREKYKELHAEGLSDKHIADKVGVAAQTAHNMRHELELKSNRYNYVKVDLRKLTNNLIRIYFDDGLSDAEIADAIGGMNINALIKRRLKLGLRRK